MAAAPGDWDDVVDSEAAVKAAVAVGAPVVEAPNHAIPVALRNGNAGLRLSNSDPPAVVVLGNQSSVSLLPVPHVVGIGGTPSLLSEAQLLSIRPAVCARLLVDLLAILRAIRGALGLDLVYVADVVLGLLLEASFAIVRIVGSTGGLGRLPVGGVASSAVVLGAEPLSAEWLIAVIDSACAFYDCAPLFLGHAQLGFVTVDSGHGSRGHLGLWLLQLDSHAPAVAFSGAKRGHHGEERSQHLG